METPKSIPWQDIPGGQALVDWFGHSPSFHDAEVLSVQLNRRGDSFLRVHTWEMTKDVDPRGYYVLTKHIVVAMLFEDIVALELQDFNQQNVVSGIALQQAADGLTLALGPCYGLNGTITAKTIRIEIEPGKPAGE